MADKLLLETGFALLLETGDALLLEGGVASPSLTLSGPSSANIYEASSNFTVTLVSGAATTVFTPTRSAGTGTFTPTSVTLTLASPVGTFTETPSNTTSRNINGTNDQGIAAPPDVAFSVPTPAITATDITAAIYQMSAGTTAKTISFSGTYTNSTPSTVEVQIINDADDSIHQDWTAISGATIAGGNWSGTFSVTKGYFFNFKARTKFAGGQVLATSAQSSNNWSVGEKVLLIGQSLMENMWLLSSTPPVTSTNTRMRTTSGGLTAVAGNGAITLANRLQSEMGCCIEIIAAAIGGTGLILGSGANTWLDLTAGQPWPLTLTLITAAGGDFGGIYNHLGYNDAIAGVAQATYETGLGTLYTRAIAAASGRTAATLPFGNMIIGQSTAVSTPDADMNKIRAAIVHFSQNTTGAFLGGSTVDLPTTDGVHPNAANEAHMGARIAQGYLYARGFATYSAVGPTIAAASRVLGSADISVSIAQNAGTVLKERDGSTDGNSLSGFEASADDFVTPLTISATAFSGTKTILTLSTPPADGDAVKVRYQNGSADWSTNPVFDNTTPGGDTLGLPLQPSITSFDVQIRTAGSGMGRKRSVLKTQWIT